MHRLPQRSTLVAQTAAILRERIQAREWRKWLPGEHELCGQLHLARMTLRRALAELEREGLVRASQGRRREIVGRPRGTAVAASGRVLLLTPQPLQYQPPFHLFLAGHLRETLEQAGYHLEVHASRAPYGRNGASSLRGLMQQLRPVACVLFSSTRTMQRWFSRRRSPCVIVGSRYPRIELACVDKAYRALCRHAVGLFVARGHRRLALLNPQGGAAGDLESELGLKEGVAQSHEQGVAAAVLRHAGTAADICAQLDGLLRRRNAPTALLVSRATYVLTVIGHLLRRGVRLPQDVALISRDDEPFLDQMVPSVARYLISPQTMAGRVSSAVLDVVQHGWVSPASHLIMPEFSEGETLGSSAPRRENV